MWCVEPCRHENIMHVSFQLRPCGGLPTERCFRFAVWSFLLSLCYRFHAWCKLENHVAQQCFSTRLQLSKPSQFGTVVGFLCVCTRFLHTTSRMSRVFHKSHRGLSLFLPYWFTGGGEYASRKTEMRALISYMGGLILSHMPHAHLGMNA